MNDELISVLMPCHNCDLHLAEALESILDQTWENLEVILINDGSTDRTGELCDAYAALDKRITYISKRNSGLVHTLNFGLLRCRGQVIARMDGDDVSFPHRLEVEMEALRLGRCAAVSSGFVSIDVHGNVLNARIPPRIEDAEPGWLPPREPYLPHPFMLIRATELRALGGYRHVIHAEDADLCWRMVPDHRLWNVPDVLGKYRLHSASVSSKSAQNARVQAVYAALAAISHTRRRAGQPDIAFNWERNEVEAGGESLEMLLRMFEDQLSREELHRVAAGAGLKFLDFSSFRKYPVPVSDVDYTLYHFRQVADVESANREWAELVITQRYKVLDVGLVPPFSEPPVA